MYPDRSHIEVRPVRRLTRVLEPGEMPLTEDFGSEPSAPACRPQVRSRSHRRRRTGRPRSRRICAARR
jgi:hypothetical protein